MNDIEIFGVNWKREILRQPELYVKSLIAVIKYTSDNGDTCFIANDVINLLPYSETFKWKIDNNSVLSKIHDAHKERKPLFICFNEEQKNAIKRTVENSSIINVDVIASEEIFC